MDVGCKSLETVEEELERSGLVKGGWLKSEGRAVVQKEEFTFLGRGEVNE